MPKSRQTNATPNKPATTQPITAQAQPPMPDNRSIWDGHEWGYGKTVLGKFAYGLGGASKEEIAFLEEFAEEWSHQMYTAGEIAVSHGLAHLHVWDFGSPDEWKRHAKDVDRFTRTLSFADDWLIKLLRAILRRVKLPHIECEEKPISSPEDVLALVQEAWIEYQRQLNSARSTIQANPELFRKEVA
ncbi:MAG: hypothetical protein WBY44_28770 [Bryobacteraceae bacterium]